MQAADTTACCSSAACVEAFPTLVRAGAVWVWPDSSPTAAHDSSLAMPSVDTVLEVRDRPSICIKPPGACIEYLASLHVLHALGGAADNLTRLFTHRA